jgi:cold shock CspA family protein
MSNLREGQKLTYELEKGRSGKMAAVNLKAM